MLQHYAVALETAQSQLEIISSTLPLWLSQVQLAQVAAPEQFVVTFLPGSQFLIALVAGVAMAFAFQFLLSNFSIAIGISAGINPADTEADGWGKKLRRVEAKVGSTTLLIVNAAVFTACFLAVKLTPIGDAEG